MYCVSCCVYADTGSVVKYASIYYIGLLARGTCLGPQIREEALKIRYDLILPPV